MKDTKTSYGYSGTSHKDHRIPGIPHSRVVILQTPTEPLFVGSYIKVPVIIDRRTGLTINDLDFNIPAGSKGGLISLSHDKKFDPANPDIMLLAGYEPGVYQLQAIQRSSGSVLANAEFSVTTRWSNDQEGPSIWVTGDFVLPGISGGTWGGGSPTDPENYDVTPVKGKRNLAVLFLDTSSQRYNPNEVQGIQNLWEDITYNGQVISGKTVSVAHYYREVSYDQLDITGQVFGPVNLPDAWDDYFNFGKNIGINDSLWEPKGHFWQACVTAGDPLINYKDFQHLVCVVRSVDATATTRRKGVWPWGGPEEAKTEEGDIPLGMVAMPADGSPFGLCATLCHELGHNFHWGDQYPWEGHSPQIKARTVGAWELMAYEGGLPHPVLVHRMRVGWVPKDKIKLYNFQAIGGYVDETITLHPLELGNPPAGRYSGIEVRIAPSWDYYFEYRMAQGKQIGDQNLPTNNRVLGTDVMYSEDLETVTRRKPVMLLENDADGDGPVLGSGQDFKAKDTSDWNSPTDFRVEVTSNDGTKADVRIQYGVYSQPDPSIRPWHPPVYQSPDIEITNERSKADPQWLNVPWENRYNTVTAKITNLGALNAPGVWVDFYVHDYTLNNPGAQPFKIDQVQKDVPAKQTVEFSTIWRPVKAGHYCIEARIRHYQTPGINSVIEATEYNNRAQSNYDRFISQTASAPSREMASAKVHNPFSEPVRAYIHVAKSTSPLFRTYVEHKWLILQPGETRDVQLMFEYAYEKDPVWIPELERYIRKPNDVSICAIVHNHDELSQERIMLGGVTAQIVKGRATKIEDFGLDYPVAVGQVITVDKGDPVPGGKVILIIKPTGEEEYRTVEVSQDGYFKINVPNDWNWIQAYYVPLEGYADSTSQIITRP